MANDEQILHRGADITLCVRRPAGAAFIMFFLGGKKEPKKPPTQDSTAPALDQALIKLHYYSRIVALSGQVLTGQYNFLHRQNVLTVAVCTAWGCWLFLLHVWC